MRQAATGAEAGVDAAVQDARRVVGLYGDPRVTWSIMLELDLARSLDAGLVETRLDALAAGHAHLGRRAILRRFPAADRALTMEQMAAEAYGDRDPLLRVALSEDERLLVVGGHHGALDGFGMLGAAASLLDRPLGTASRGLRRTGRRPSFLVGGLRRLGEAVFRPPARFAVAARGVEPGDWLLDRPVDAGRVGTAAIVWAVTQALRELGAHLRGRQPVVAIGVSHRSGAPPLQPDRDTGFMRVRTRSASSVEDVEALLRATQPEPDFPPGQGGPVARLAELLAERLGASALVSNLGRIEGSEDLVGARLWPAPSGPAGVAVGLVTAGDRTTVTVRTRRDWFSRVESEQILDAVVRHLASGNGPQ